MSRLVLLLICSEYTNLSFFVKKQAKNFCVRGAWENEL